MQWLWSESRRSGRRSENNHGLQIQEKCYFEVKARLQRSVSSKFQCVDVQIWHWISIAMGIRLRCGRPFKRSNIEKLLRSSRLLVFSTESDGEAAERLAPNWNDQNRVGIAWRSVSSWRWNADRSEGVSEASKSPSWRGLAVGSDRLSKFCPCSKLPNRSIARDWSSHTLPSIIFGIAIRITRRISLFDSN
jgi:hypothetical protein